MKKTILTTTIALLLGAGTLQNAHADLNNGLVAHWSFDDCKATDNSGNGHDGTINGNPQCVDGVKGKAFSFDGVQDFVEIQNMATDMKKGFSISSWITTDANVENYRVIVSKGKKETGHYEIYIEPNYNAALVGEFRFYSPDMIKSSNDDVHVKGDLGSTKVVNDNKPHALFVSNDGDITKFFVDGVLVHEEKTTGFLNDSSDNQLFIARQVDDGQMFFKGIIDDLRIYNRALTEAEVLELYKGEEAKPVDLSLALTAPTSVKISEKATYQLTATNNGNAPATGVKAHFVIPRKAFATLDVPQNCTLNGRIVECMLSDLEANQSATQTFSMKLLKKGAVSVNGLINSIEDDANYDDNKKSAVVSVK